MIIFVKEAIVNIATFEEGNQGGMNFVVCTSQTNVSEKKAFDGINWPPSANSLYLFPSTLFKCSTSCAQSEYMS